jgi:hypothetical protein
MMFEVESELHSHIIRLEPEHVLAFLVSLVDVSMRVSRYRGSKEHLPNRAMQAWQPSES